MSRINLTNKACAGLSFANTMALALILRYPTTLHGFPTIMAKAFAIRFVLEAAVAVLNNSFRLNARQFKILDTVVFAGWGVASIVALRQVNLINRLGTAILSGFLALNVGWNMVNIKGKTQQLPQIKF